MVSTSLEKSAEIRLRPSSESRVSAYSQHLQALGYRGEEKDLKSIVACTASGRKLGDYSSRKRNGF